MRFQLVCKGLTYRLKALAQPYKRPHYASGTLPLGPQHWLAP